MSLAARSLAFLALVVPVSLVACAAPEDDGIESTADAITGSVRRGATLTTSSRVNLREGPGRGEDLIVTMPRGARVTAVREQPVNGFYEVSYGGHTGWAFGAYLEGTGQSPGSEDDRDDEATQAEGTVVSSFTSRGTGYYPANSRLEGGFVDRIGRPLKTLQQFLDGDASYVSVAMDTNAFRYGTRLRIRELDEKYGRSIVFRVVDTGGAFRGKGRSRIDVCVKDRAASLDATINGTLHIDVIAEQ